MENEDKYILAHSLIDKYGRNLEEHYRLKGQFKPKADYVDEANNAILDALIEGKFHAYLRPNKQNDVLIKVPQAYWEDGNIKGKIDNLDGYKLINTDISILYKALESQLLLLERYLIMPKTGKRPAFNWSKTPDLELTFRYPLKYGEDIFHLVMPQLATRWLQLSKYFRSNHGKIMRAYFITKDVSEYYKEEGFAPLTLPNKNRKTVSTEMWIEIIRAFYKGFGSNLKQDAIIFHLEKYMSENNITHDEKANKFEDGYPTYLIRKIWTELKISKDKLNEKTIKKTTES